MGRRARAGAQRPRKNQSANARSKPRLLRDEFKQKEEHNANILTQRDRDFEDYKKNVEIEWPARFESRGNEIAEKARKQMAEKESEFAVARQRWLEEATDMRMKLMARMNEVQASFTQKEEELQRKYLQKQHELTTQFEKTTSDLQQSKLSFENQKAEYERLAQETRDQRRKSSKKRAAT